MTHRIAIEDRLEAGRYVLRAALPDVDPATDLRITCTGAELCLDAVREPPAAARHARSEFRYGRRLRVVALPAGTRTRTLTARYVAGVLEVSARLGAVEPRGRPFRVPVTSTARRSRRRGTSGPDLAGAGGVRSR